MPKNTGFTPVKGEVCGFHPHTCGTSQKQKQDFCFCSVSWFVRVFLCSVFGTCSCSSMFGLFGGFCGKNVGKLVGKFVGKLWKRLWEKIRKKDFHSFNGGFAQNGDFGGKNSTGFCTAINREWRRFCTVSTEPTTTTTN